MVNMYDNGAARARAERRATQRDTARAPAQAGGAIARIGIAEYLYM